MRPIQMDTTISKDDIGITTFLEPDNIYMGSVVAEAIFQKMGGKGNVIMTQGALGHTGAQGRAAGFKEALAKYPDIKLLAEDPADWDVNKLQSAAQIVWNAATNSSTETEDDKVRRIAKIVDDYETSTG